MDDWDAADVKTSEPFFICVEAKRQLSYGVADSKTQLLAQIRALQVQRLPLSQTSS